jgi:regulatory protein YycI of two-component signal transduction system YycFG
MSVYQFLSSDTPLRIVKNTKLEWLSVEEAEAREIFPPNWHSEDETVSRTDKVILYVPDRECLNEIEILDDSDSFYAAQYSGKRCHFSLQWLYSEERGQQLKDYIEEHVRTGSEIELWNIWLDGEGRPSFKRIHVDELTVSDIERTVEQDPYEAPRCLIISP